MTDKTETGICPVMQRTDTGLQRSRDISRRVTLNLTKNWKIKYDIVLREEYWYDIVIDVHKKI